MQFMALLWIGKLEKIILLEQQSLLICPAGAEKFEQEKGEQFSEDLLAGKNELKRNWKAFSGGKRR